MNYNKHLYHFLEDEVRNGFYIPAIMKQFWGAEIETLRILDEILTKHNLKYFADAGTMLGAVRHGGFIPWDDDLDICMLREDYMALLKLQDEHPEEFPEGFKIRSFRNRDDYTEFHAVVVPNDRICFEPEYLERFCGFPYMVAIDIFILDHKSVSDEKQRIMAKDALFVIAAADQIASGVLSDKRQITNVIERIKKFDNVEDFYFSMSTSPIEMRRQLYELAETMFMSFSDENSDYLIKNIPWGVLHPERKINKTDFQDSVRVGFEYFSIPISKKYNHVLTYKYRKYYSIVKNTAIHEYPCFGAQEKEFKESLDFDIPHFIYNPAVHGEIEKLRTGNRTNSWKNIVKECSFEMGNIIAELENDIPETQTRLADLQQLAIDLGNFIESIKGTDCNVIKYIEKFCEAVYSYYITIGGEQENGRDCVIDSFSALSSELENLVNKEEVLFITFKKSGWEYVKNLYYKEIADGADARVMPIPYYHKKYDGSVVDEIFEGDFEEPDICIEDYKEYDLESHYPDRIYFQFPYDEWNPSMTVSPDFYTMRLASFTENLIYVPWFETTEFTKKDISDLYNMKYYVPMPGVMYSDKVILYSLVIKEHYLDFLSEFAGSESYSFWDRKIQVAEKQKSIMTAEKKILLYIGLYSFTEDANTITDKLQDVMQNLDKAPDDVLFTAVFDPAIREWIYNDGPEYKDVYLRCRNILEKSNRLVLRDYDILTHDIAKEFDAYYGALGPITVDFVTEGKPVMLWKVDCK